MALPEHPLKTFALATLGCKINQYESAAINHSLTQAGYTRVKYNQPADLYIINSCTVTGRTDYKSRNLLRKALAARQTNSAIKIVVTGCWAQMEQGQDQLLALADYVVDNNHKHLIASIVTGGDYNFSPAASFTTFSNQFTNKMPERSRAFVKIQDGCDNFCAYCRVAHARGKPRSQKPEQVINQITALVNNGYPEVVLGGINLGLWGKDLGLSFADLLAQIEQIPGLAQYRLSSIEPQLFTPELLEFFAKAKKLAPHFHIPLQSGCDTLLASMGRHYTTAQFAQLISKLHTIFDTPAIGLDVIAGLPGETDELFANTKSFIQSLPITYLHVFTYSKRPNTKAALMPQQVERPIKAQRTNELMCISQLKIQTFVQNLCAQKTPLTGVIETCNNGWWTALSNRWVRVYVNNTDDLSGRFCSFIPLQSYLDGVKVELSL